MKNAAKKVCKTDFQYGELEAVVMVEEELHVLNE
jgi:hypothetical protein